MKQWYDDEYVPEIWTYNPKIKKYPDNVKLSHELSLLTNFFLNTFLNSFEKRDLIVTFPDIILRPIPIASYLYAYLKSKSVIVFTQKSDGNIQNNPVEIHNRNYHLLNYNGDYIFRYIPIGIISDNGVEAKVYLPRASKNLKQKYVQEQKKNFLDEIKPRILLCSEGKRVAESIEKIILDEEVFDNLDIKVEIGLIIFENIDRFVNSHYSAKQFLKWI